MPNLATESIGKLLVLVMNAETPSNEEWAQYIDRCRSMDREHGLHAITNLIFADGSGPNAVQRAKGNEMLENRTPKVAVVTTSRLVRGAATAVGWFNPRLKAFAPAGWRQAFEYLEIPAPQYQDVVTLLRRLESRVGTVQALREALGSQRG